MLVLARTLTRTAGRPAATVAVPLFLGIAVVAAVLFGPDGMSAADAVAAMNTSWPVRVALWAGWLAATLPAARMLFAAPGTFYLRALPVPRWHFGAVHAAHLAVLELPWALFHVRGGGWNAGLGAASMTVAAHALLCARSARAPEIAAAALVLLAVWVRSLEVPAGCLAAIIGVRAAFLRAPELSGRVRRGAVRGARVRALSLSYLAAVRRRSGETVVRAIAATAAGAGMAMLAARNNDVSAAETIVPLALAVQAPFLVAGLGGIQQRIALAERASGWLLDSTGTARRVRVAAAAGAAAIWGAALGLAHGALLPAGVAVAPMLHLRLAFGCAVWGATLACIGAAAARRAHGGGGGGAGASLVLVIGAVAAAALLGELAILGGALAALVVSLAQAGQR